MAPCSKYSRVHPSNADFDGDNQADFGAQKFVLRLSVFSSPYFDKRDEQFGASQCLYSGYF